ncbi:MAG: alpha/beta hydrolase [Myxococcales bacterium]|nr:alpha/beta hydrolase [Myxococcales bacterium]
MSSNAKNTPHMGPLAMQRLNVGADHHLAFHTAGDTGTPVLLIMGYCVPGRAWRFQWPVLSQQHRVALFDNRGTGGSGAPKGPWRMSDLADDAIALMDHLGWERAHVVGVSMGGMVAQHLSLRARHRVSSMSLIATQAGGLRAMLPGIGGLKRFAMANVGPRQERGRHLASLLFPPSFVEEVGRPWLESVLMDDFGDPIPSRSRRLQLGAIAGHRTSRRLGQLHDLPSLIVRPGADLLIAPSQSDRLAQLLPHADVLRIDDAGHGVIRQSAATINAALLRLFARADGLAAG